MTDSVPDSSPLSPLPANLFRHVPFQRFWGTRVMSSLAFQILSVAIGWYVYALTHSAFALGLVGLAQFVPMFALTLVVGQVADRYDRRRIATICQASRRWPPACSCSAPRKVAGRTGRVRARGDRRHGPRVRIAVGVVAAAGRRAPTCARNRAVDIGEPGRADPRARVRRAAVWRGRARRVRHDVVAFAVAAVLSGTIPLRSAPPAREPVTLRSVFSGIAFIREPAILARCRSTCSRCCSAARPRLPIYARDILQVGPWPARCVRRLRSARSRDAGSRGSR